MKTKLIIGFFLFSSAICLTMPTAQAQKKAKTTPATHMWLQNYENLLFVPVRSVEQCEMLVKQAAMINSSDALCYLNEKLVKRIECIKPVKRNGTPSCS